MSLYSSLVAFWKMDEASGSRADSVGSSTLTDNATVTSNTGLVYATAAEYTIANSEYLSAADNAALSMGDIDFWVAGWFKFPAKAATQSLVTKWDSVSTKREYRLILSTTRFQFIVSGDGTASTTLSADLNGTPANSYWHLVVAWHDSTANTINISIDGGPADSTAHTTGVFDSTAAFRIGATVSNAGAQDFFGGNSGPVMIGKGYIPTAEDITYLWDSRTGITLAEMAADTGHQVINFRNLGDSTAPPDINSTTDATSYANASWIPPTNGVIGCWLFSREASGNTTPTSFTGNSLTWTLIGTVLFGTFRRLSLYAADATGATTGATTINYGANTQTTCAASFFHILGLDLSGGLAAAFVQAPSNNGTATSGSITLSAAGNVNNRAISCFVHDTNEGSTARTNWIKVDDLGSTSPARAVMSAWRHDAFETTASATWTTSSVWGGLAIELKAAPSGKAFIYPSNPLRLWKKRR